MGNKDPKSPKPHRYDEGFKRKVAKAYLNGEGSYSALGKRYGIKATVVPRFVHWYRSKLHQENSNFEIIAIKMDDLKSLSESELQDRIKELEKRLQLTQLKTEYLETLIDVAEKDLKIDIRKKPGTSQSKP